ncbi:MAG: dephospho-CoA kinase [Christensenellaceae bacterium]|jgi:dephospho-CoA kinase|nr:dephospho-CoA kinase [Christensenellaceae bacterium]
MIVAISGGIGAGKSEVARILERRGYLVIKTDEINRQLMMSQTYINSIKEVFPTAVDHRGINREALRKLVFSDEALRRKLNSISHPAITKKIKDISHTDQIVFVEIPLLIESGMCDYFDRIWYIDAPVINRINRIIKRDNESLEIAKSIISSQAQEEETLKYSNDVILNNDSIESLERIVDGLLETLCKKK